MKSKASADETKKSKTKDCNSSKSIRQPYQISRWFVECCGIMLGDARMRVKKLEETKSTTYVQTVKLRNCYPISPDLDKLKLSVPSFFLLSNNNCINEE